MTCKHEKFLGHFKVARLEDSGNFMADITIKCSECNLPFQFNGIPQVGLNMHGAATDLEALELRISISPKGSKPNPVQFMGFGIKKIDG